MPDAVLRGVIDNETGIPIGYRTHGRGGPLIGMPVVLLQRYSNSGGVTGTTAETPLDVSLVIPGGLLGPNGGLRVSAWWQGTNNANSKIVQIKLGGTTISGASVNMASNSAFGIQRTFGNRGSETLNRWFGSSSAAVPFGGIAAVDTAIDTTVDQLLTFTVQLAVATDSVWLAGALVELMASE